MKTLIISFIAMMLCSCAGPNLILMQPDKMYATENKGKTLFSLAAPDNGKWYLGAAETMQRGVINIQGAPVNSYMGYTLRFRMITHDDNPSFLRSIIPVLKTGDYERFLQDSLDWYTEERLIEQKKQSLAEKSYTFLVCVARTTGPVSALVQISIVLDMVVRE